MADNIIVVVYLIAVLALGFYKGRNIKSMLDFSIADRNYSLPIMVATMTATFIGGGSTLGMISSVFSLGLVYVLISFGDPINNIFVSKFFINKLDRFAGCISIGDIMHSYYGKPARVISGICGAIYCAAAVGGQVSAIGFIVNYFLGLPFIVGVAIGAGSVVLYSSFGGIRAVTATDVLQFAVLIIAIPMICNIGLNLIGGYEALYDKVPKTLLTLPSETNSIINYVFIFLGFTIPFLDPPQTQRLLMGKNRDQIRNTLYIASVIQILFFILIALIAFIAAAMYPGYEPNMVFPHLVNTIVPTGLKGLAVAGLLSVVMSTADSYLNAGGITLVHDTIKPLYTGVISDKNEIRLAQIITFVLGTISTVVALSFPTIMSIILFSLNFWGPIIVVPLYAALLGKKASPKCLYVGITSGVSVFLIWHFFIEPKLEIGSLIPSMAANALGFIIVYYFEKLKNKNSNAKPWLEPDVSTQVVK